MCSCPSPASWRRATSSLITGSYRMSRTKRKGPTSSPVRSGRVATRPVETLVKDQPKRADEMPSSSATTDPSMDNPSRSKKISWDKLKVFEEPECRLAYKLGRNAPAWLKVAVEAGLVATASPKGDYHGGGLLRRIGNKPLPRMKPGQLEETLAKAMAASLEKMKQ